MEATVLKVNESVLLVDELTRDIILSESEKQALVKTAETLGLRRTCIPYGIKVVFTGKQFNFGVSRQFFLRLANHQGIEDVESVLVYSPIVRNHRVQELAAPSNSIWVDGVEVITEHPEKYTDKFLEHVRVTWFKGDELKQHKVFTCYLPEFLRNVAYEDRDLGVEGTALAHRYAEFSAMQCANHWLGLRLMYFPPVDSDCDQM